MHVVLEILDGPLAGRTVELQPGQSVSVGRTAKSQLMLPHDNFLSGIHFLVEYADTGCVLRDCNSSNGTWVNGERVTEQPLTEGDQISAGQTRFRVYPSPEAETESTRSSTVLFSVPNFNPYVTGPVPIVSETQLSPEQQRVVDFLRMSIAPVYALLDAQSEPSVPQFLNGSGEIFQFLPDGMPATSLSAPAVYLLALPSTSPILPRLVREGWGRKWMVFLTCAHPFPDVQNHFRQLMFLYTTDGRPFTFRYFDPHLLQHFLPACSSQEITNFFGPVQSFVTEHFAEPAKMLEFRATPQGLARRELPLR